MLPRWKGSVHHTWWGFIDLLCGERDKGGTAPPLSIPAAPRGNRCCALRSPPACLTAAGSIRLTRPIHGTRPSGASASAVQNCSRQFCPVSVRLCPPSMASRPCHSRFGSPISAGTQPPAVISQIKTKPVSVKARFCRPDKAKPPSGNDAVVIMPDGALHAYPAYAVSGVSFPAGVLAKIFNIVLAISRSPITTWFAPRSLM